MNRVCHTCGRSFTDDGYVRCRTCREQSKVGMHQLFRRRQVKGYVRHDCALCRKHQRFVRSKIASWEASGGLPEERKRAAILRAHGTFERYIRWHRKMSKGVLGYPMTPWIP